MNCFRNVSRVFNRQPQAPNQNVTPAPTPSSDPPFARPLQFEVTLEELLLEGAMGDVHKATATPTEGPEKGVPRHDVVVKWSMRGEGPLGILNEYRTLLHLGLHSNLVELIGTGNTAHPQLILKYCERGSLSSVLQGYETRFLDQIIDDRIDVNFRGRAQALHAAYARLWVIPTKQLLIWALQAASGAEYMAERGVIHNSLLSENIWLAWNGVAKIASFELSQRSDEGGGAYEPEFRLAQYYWPPETSLEHWPPPLLPEFDRWTFGILLWELFSLGRRMNPDLQSAVELPQPRYATTGLYATMRSCWATEPEGRPGFRELRDGFAALLGDPEAGAAWESADFDFASNLG